MGTTPCFADQPALSAGAVYQELRRYAHPIEGDTGPPPRAYGTCKVDHGTIVEADGSLVAELGCSVRIVRKGIYDALGIQLGARGRHVVQREKASSDQTSNLRCVSNGPTQVRCMFIAGTADYTPTSYVVAGALHDESMLVGSDAIAFFGDREILEIAYSVDCH